MIARRGSSATRLLDSRARVDQYDSPCVVPGGGEIVGRFRLDETADLRIAFGSCPKWQDDRVQPIWPWVVHHEPDIFFWIGDNIYGDTLDPDILREEYRRQRSRFSGTVAGVGLGLRSREGRIFVIRVVPKSPAARAKIRTQIG